MTKYLFLTKGGSWFPQFMKRKITGAGMWNWVRAFKGDYKLLRHLDASDIAGELEKYDIVHVNFSGHDTDLPLLLRRRLGNGSSTKIVANMDYNVEYFQSHVLAGAFTLSDFILAINACDMLFAVEPYQQNFLQYIFDENAKMADAVGKRSKRMNIPLIPHPLNMDLKTMLVPFDERLEMLLVDFHRYDMQLFIPSLLTRGLPLINGLQPHVLLTGYTGDVNIFGMKDLLFDGALQYDDWGKFVNIMMNSAWGLSYYTIHSQDRFAAEAACLKIPTVTSHNSYLGRILWPAISHPVTEIQKMRDSLKRIITDEKFYEQVAEEAFEKAEMFKFDTSVEKLEVALGLR